MKSCLQTTLGIGLLWFTAAHSDPTSQAFGSYVFVVEATAELNDLNAPDALALFHQDVANAVLKPAELSTVVRLVAPGPDPVEMHSLGLLIPATQTGAQVTGLEPRPGMDPSWALEFSAKAQYFEYRCVQCATKSLQQAKTDLTNRFQEPVMVNTIVRYLADPAGSAPARSFEFLIPRGQTGAMVTQLSVSGCERICPNPCPSCTDWW